jgi:hypothetical protein
MRLVPVAIRLAIIASGAFPACFPKLPDEADVVDAAPDDAAASETNGGADASGDTGTDATGDDVLGCSGDEACKPLAGVCQKAQCVEGACVVSSIANGTGCDDGNACTSDDMCTDGICGGAPKLCEAVSSCHLAGTCNPADGMCSTPTKLDGSGCDDGNVCTLDDACDGGLCVGPRRPSSTANIAHVLGANGDVVFSAAGETPSHELIGVGLAFGTELNISGIIHPQQLDGCALFVAEMDGSPNTVAVLPWWSSTNCTKPVMPGPALRVHTDGSFVFGGLFEDAFPAGPVGAMVGLGTLGLVETAGLFIARFQRPDSPSWVVSFVGFPPVRDEVLSRHAYTTGPMATSLVALNSNGSDVGEGLDAQGRSLVVAPDASGGRQVQLMLVSARGDLSPSGRLVAKDSDGFGARDVVALDDGAFAVITSTEGGVITHHGVDGTQTILPKGVGTFTYTIVSVFGPDGTLRWSRALAIAPGPQTPAGAEDVLALAAGASNEGLALALNASAGIQVRDMSGRFEPVLTAFPNGEPTGGEHLWVNIHGTSGNVLTADVVRASDLQITGIVGDDLGALIIGYGKDVSAGAETIGQRGVAELFVMRPSRWVRVLARPAVDTGTVVPSLVPGGDVLPFPTLTRVGAGGAVIAGAAFDDFWVGAGNNARSAGRADRFSGYVLRENAFYSIDCER